MYFELIISNEKMKMSVINFYRSMQVTNALSLPTDT